jgi:hypothetical protein
LVDQLTFASSAGDESFEETVESHDRKIDAVGLKDKWRACGEISSGEEESEEGRNVWRSECKEYESHVDVEEKENVKDTTGL